MALTDKDEAKQIAGSSVKFDGGTGMDVTGAANACNSFWKAEEGVAGAKGALLLTGLAQQTGIAQPFESQPWQQQLALWTVTFATGSAEARKTL